MNDVVELAAWREARRPAGAETVGHAVRPEIGRTRNVARVRPIPASWDPSPGGGGPGVAGTPHEAGARGRARTGIGAVEEAGLDAVTIARLDRAVASIDRATARVAARGGRLAPDVETELLALVGQISLGLITDAVDRAEQVARRLGDSTSSRGG